MTLSNADKKQLAEWLRANERHRSTIYADLFEPFSTNGSFTPVDNIGLTEAPAVASYVDSTEDGETFIPDDALLWAFTDYQIRDELEELAKAGSVIFPLVSGEYKQPERRNAVEWSTRLRDMKSGESIVVNGADIYQVSAKCAYYRKTRNDGREYVNRTQKSGAILVIRVA